jgi:hypothetical protein
MSIEPGRWQRQSEAAEPIVENPALPYMTAGGASSAELMPPAERLTEGADHAAVPPLFAEPQQAAAERMAPFDGEDAEREAPVGTGAQREAPPARTAPQGRSDGYLRLRLRLEDGAISVVGARAVDGPLALDDSLQGELVYEVRAGNRRIGIGAVPDVGEMRSFPPPEPREGQIGHHVVPLRATEFNVRVPMDVVSATTLDAVEIDVYHVKTPPDRRRLTAEPLADQFDQELRPIARLKGLAPERLEPRVRDELKRALR